MFKNINNQFKSILISYSLMITLAYLYGNPIILLTISVLPITFFALASPILTLCASIICLPLVSPLGGKTEILISSFVISSTFLHLIIRKNKIKKSHIFLLLIIFITSLISYAVGYKTAVTTLIAFIIVITTCGVTFALLKEHGPNNLNYSFMLSALILIFIVLYELLTGHNSLLYGRFNFAGSIRVLANTIVVPLLVCTYFILEKRDLLMDRKIQISKMDYSLFILLLIMLLFTVSRGVIFAYFSGIAILLMKGKKKFIKTAILGFIIILVVLFADQLGVIRIKRLFEVSLDMNSRTGIWDYYLGEMASRGILGIIFGQGPGNITRVAINTPFASMYVHSTILDILFSYGLLGFTIFLIIIFKIAISVTRNTNRLAAAILVATLLMYSTHGTATNREFFILLSFTYYLSLCRNSFMGMQKI